MFDVLTEDNVLLYAVKAYERPNCIRSEFKDDFKRFSYLLLDDLCIGTGVVGPNVDHCRVDGRVFAYSQKGESYAAENEDDNGAYHCQHGPF